MELKQHEGPDEHRNPKANPPDNRNSAELAKCQQARADEQHHRNGVKPAVAIVVMSRDDASKHRRVDDKYDFEECHGPTFAASFANRFARRSCAALA